jgi:uncharacterized membrane protein
MGNTIGSGKLMEITSGVGVIDMEFAYTQEFVYNTLQAQGEAGRLFYKNLLIRLDFIFPLVNALFFTSIVMFVYKKITNNKKLLTRLAIFPFMIMLFDYLENIFELILLNNYPTQLATIVKLGSLATSCKILAIGSSTIIIIVGIVIIVINKIKTKKGEIL